MFSIHKCAALAPHDSEERGGITHRSKGQSFKSPSDHCHFFCVQRLLINSPNTPHPKATRTVPDVCTEQAMAPQQTHQTVR